MFSLQILVRAGELLVSTLERHPRLLTYDAPAGSSGPLCCGAARASVALVDTPGGGPQVRHAAYASALRVLLRVSSGLRPA